MKKYELTSEYVEFDGRKLYRIKALKSFYLCGLTVKAGLLADISKKKKIYLKKEMPGFMEMHMFTIMPMFVITHISARKHGFMEMLKSAVTLK